MSPGSTQTALPTRVLATAEVTASVSAQAWRRTLSAAVIRASQSTGAHRLCAVSQGETSRKDELLCFSIKLISHFDCQMSPNMFLMYVNCPYCSSTAYDCEFYNKGMCHNS